VEDNTLGLCLLEILQKKGEVVAVGARIYGSELWGRFPHDAEKKRKKSARLGSLRFCPRRKGRGKEKKGLGMGGSHRLSGFAGPGAEMPCVDIDPNLLAVA